MILNYDKKFAIFSPWKTASSTMATRLVHYDQSPYSRFYDFNPYLQRIVHQHITVADYKALPENSFDLKRVSFVRNPYDRVYSGFLQIQKDLKEQPLMGFPAQWIRNHVLMQLALNEERLQKANFDFDAWFALIEPEDIYQIGGNSSFPMHPSHYWTHDHEHKFVDFLGKVETFEDDFVKLLDFLKISDSYNLENANVNHLGGEESSTTYKYISKMSKASIEKINHLFEKDFQLFGYEMM